MEEKTATFAPQGTVASMPKPKLTPNLNVGKSIICPECGIPNPVSRATCEICHVGLYPKGKEKVMDETAKELYAMNKKLKQAILGKDEKMAKKVRGQIKVAVAKTGDTFKVAESGLATQAKALSPKEKKEKVPKVLRKCPCCGEEVGGYFKMGHDGRVHGILIKIELGKAKMTEFPKAIQDMYGIWKKDKSLSMKTIAQKLGK